MAAAPAGTQMTQVVIEQDKAGDGLTIGDTFFDTAPGGQGSFASPPRFNWSTREGFRPSRSRWRTAARR